MRWVVLLAFGTFGAILLFLARGMFLEIRADVASMRAVEGVIASIDESRDTVAVKYPFAIETGETPVAGTAAPAPREEEREFYTSRPSKTSRVGDKIRILYHPAKPDSPQTDNWITLYQNALILAGGGLVAIFLALGSFSTLTPDYAGPTPAEKPAIALTEPIELYRNRSQLVSIVVFTLAGMAAMVYLARNPGFLWTRFLAYPVVFAGFIICLVVLASVYDGWTERLRVNQDGIEKSSAWKGTTRIAWTDVARIKRVRSVRSDYSSGRRRTSSSPPHIVLLGRSGQKLLDLSLEGWDPPEHLGTLVDYIPQRTGLGIVDEVN
jgi:hypothetical protein